MRGYGSGALPRHLYVWVDRMFIRPPGLSVGFERAVWFGLGAMPGRAWGCHVMLECGAVYRSLPPHAIAFHPEAKPWGIQRSQLWDCYGVEFATLIYPYLDGLDCRVRFHDQSEMHGSYLFTVVPIGDAFSARPEQAKEFTFIELENGRLTIQPTDRVLFTEASFTEYGGWPILRRQNEVYYSEGISDEEKP